jgi:4-hydroxymandelate synthase
MSILGVDHVEFFVGDARQAAFVLCTAFGFRVEGQGGPENGLPGQRSLLLVQGAGRVLLTSGLTADHPATGYVSRHGDGVAVIAFGAENVEEAYAESVAAGAVAIEPPKVYESNGDSVTIATVSGFGDVVHRLVERHGPGREFLPGAIEMIGPEPHTADGAQADVSQPGAESGVDQTPDILRGIDHAAVCVPAGELESTVEYYQKAFGFKLIFEEYIEIGEQGMFSQVVQSKSGGVTFTLIQPDMSRRPGQIDDFLAWHDGPGVQHLALSTTDIVSAVDTLAGRGVGFAFTPDGYYEMLTDRLGPIDLPVDRLRPRGILVDRDHWGQMYQIFAKSMHIRRTFFWELIERHGARTFGTSNIPALYAAKERELAGVRDTTAAGLS